MKGGTKNMMTKFKDLSISLQAAIVLLWVMIGFYALAFLIGFISVFM